MRHLLCVLAVLTVTACSSPAPESGPSTSPPVSSGSDSEPGSRAGSGADSDGGSSCGADSGRDSGSGSSSDASAGPSPGSSADPGPGSDSGPTSDSQQDRMIGFRLKRLDQLIETTFDQLLGKAGLDRREWQTLNTISRGPADEAQLTDALRPFWEANGEKISDVLGTLTTRGWLHRDADSRYTLTPAGQTAHRTAMTEVGSLRERMTEGVSAQEFTQMMDVLHRMIVNLETP